ncbi:MAG: helix-turn-helix domain-containing protein [Chloroflexota bacterium]
MRRTISWEEGQQLWVMFDTTYYALLKARDQELKDEGILLMQSGILALVVMLGDNAFPAEMARRLVREPHSVSQILTRMERKGLVRRVPDPRRRNGIRIEATRKGLEVFHSARKRGSFNRIMIRISPRKRTRLMQLLDEVKRSALLETGGTATSAPPSTRWPS